MTTNIHNFLSKKSLRDIDIPPRKLLSRRTATPDDPCFQKFLPRNADSDDDSDPYSSDDFRMYEFKVRRCTRSRSHDWTDCPFAHPGEKARRRDPRRFHYSADVCPDFRGGNCSRGDNCDFSHGVFECWLHPARYRTEACKDGKICKRKVCFFAHTPKQIRVSPCDDNPQINNCNRCCVYCHSVNANSPTSTLVGFPHFSPANSPPLSPLKSRFSDRSNLNYTDSVTELGKSVERLNLNRSLLFVDVNFNKAGEQQQFVVSPSTHNQSGFISGGDGENGLTGLDLGWVNDLLT